MAKKDYTLEERYAMVDATVTLNGRPAKVSGVKCDFPMVRQIPDGLQYEYAWETIEAVIAQGGNFIVKSAWKQSLTPKEKALVKRFKETSTNKFFPETNAFNRVTLDTFKYSPCDIDDLNRLALRYLLEALDK